MEGYEGYNTIEVCPFFRRRKGSFIRCEGVNDHSVSVQSFTDRQKMIEYHDTYCCRKYDCCIIYLALMTKYSEEEEVWGKLGGENSSTAP